MVITKVFYKKQKPKIIQYRSYKNLKIYLHNSELSEFTEIFLSILDKHDPKKRKFIRANNSNFITKNFRKAILKRSKLRNKYLRERMNEAKSLYNKQRNFCVSILRKKKRDYFGSLNNEIVTDNRKFWKTISPFFSEKTFHNKKITNNVELAETFYTFFSKKIPKLSAYGFDYDSLVFIQSYLSQRQQRTKVNNPTALYLRYYMVFHKVLY